MASQTLTYKTVGLTSVKLDLYLPASANPPRGLPILVWFHGGGLLLGSRRSVAPHMRSNVSKYGYALVCADYRLAPQVRINGIVEDALDCLRFIRDHLVDQVPSGVKLDISRIGIAGSSAGGYLGLLASLYTDVAVRVVLAIYPITNPLGKFFTTSQPIFSSHIDEELLAPHLRRDAEPVSETNATSTRIKMYSYMLQEANFASLLGLQSGDNTFIVPEQVKRRRVPPCFILHGEADRMVGIEQSEELVEALKHSGVAFEYERVPHVDHRFDEDENVKLERMYAFLAKYL